MKVRPEMRHLGRAAKAAPLLACGLLVAGALVPAAAGAQSSPPPTAPEADEQRAAGEVPLTSTGDGQTTLDQTFGAQTHAEWVRETRRKALEDTKFDVQIRSYYLDRVKYDDSSSEAWALGGSLGFKTGYFRDRFSFGATGYTSQPLYGPDDADGTLLLAPGQDGYAVIGEVYGEFLINEGTRLTLGRRAFDTPFINRNDSRMTPNTFEAAMIQGLYGGTDGRPEWRWGFGYFDEIKERNAEHFVSMAEDAGAPDGVERGVYAFGANYKAGNLSIGAIDYYSDDIINIFYTEGKYTWPIADTRKLGLAMQYIDQGSVGDELLRGTDFDASQWGAKADYTWGQMLFTGAYTSASGNTDMQGPWSGYPGYTSVQVEDFNRDGESAWMLRAQYNLQSVKGASFYALYVDGSDPDSPSAYAKEELDLNAQWTIAEGAFGGLMLRFRYARVWQDDPLQQDMDDIRVMIYYDPPKL